MARRQRNELATGLFVIIGLAAGVGVLIWLGAAEVFTRWGQNVVFAAEHRQGNLGLEVGSIIKVGDAPIGKVEKITIDLAGNRVLYHARLSRRDINIHSDAYAIAVSEFIGGASIVVKSFGSDKSPLADDTHPVLLNEAPNAMLRQAQQALGYGDEQRRQFQQALKNITEATGYIRNIAATVTKQMDTKDKTALMSRIKVAVQNLVASSQNLQAITKNLKAETDVHNPASLLSKAHSIASHVEDVSSTAAEVVKNVKPDIEKTISRVRQYTERDIADILTTLRQSNTKIASIVADLKIASSCARDIIVLNRDKIDKTIMNMKSVSANLEAAAKEIRRNPWRLLQKPSKKELRDENLYDAARVFAEGAEKLNEALAELKALREARPEGIKATDPELARIQEHLRMTFEKFRLAEDALWKTLTKSK